MIFFTVLYYIISLSIAFLFTLLFNVDYTEFSNPLLYVGVGGSLLLGLILGFGVILFIIYLMGVIREKTPFDNKFNHRYANKILRFGQYLMRVKVIVTGKENIPEGNFILMSNHQENYDIIILKPIFKDHILNFIAKEALTKLPIFGRWIKLLGNIFISRDADRSAAVSIIKGIKQYKAGTSMGIFPEGKRAFGNDMIEFKAGAMKLAMKPKADILIATQYDVCKIFKKFPWRKYKVYVHISPVLKYEEFEGLRSQEVSAIVKERIQLQLDIFKKIIK